MLIFVFKGGISRKNGHLTVEYPPTFENTTTTKEAWSWDRKPVNLTCIAAGIPNATISWKLNEKDIDRDPSFIKIGNGPQSTLIVSGQLIHIDTCVQILSIWTFNKGEMEQYESVTFISINLIDIRSVSYTHLIFKTC